MQGTKSIQGSDLPVAGFEFVPDGGKLARKGVGAIALAGESQFLLRCEGPVCLRHLQHLSVRGSEKCGTRRGLLPRCGKLAGDRLGLVAFLPECQLLFDLRRLSGLRGLQARGTRRIEFCPDGVEFARKGVGPVSLLFALLFQRLLLLDLRLGGLRDFRTCDPRRLEFRPKRGKFTREGVCLVSLLLALLFQRLLLLDLRFGRLRDFRACDPCGVEFGPERGKFTREVVWPCPAPVPAPAFA